MNKDITVEEFLKDKDSEIYNVHVNIVDDDKSLKEIFDVHFAILKYGKRIIKFLDSREYPPFESGEDLRDLEYIIHV